VFKEGEASEGATTESQWRYASAVYQSLLLPIRDSTPVSALSDELPEDEGEFSDDGDELPEGGGELAGDGGALGPREETHVTVSGR